VENTRIQIRMATATDAPVVAGLLGQLGYEVTVVAIAPVLANPPAGNGFYVAVLTDQVVGFLVIARSFYLPEMRDTLRVTTLCVDAAYRRQGFGAALLNQGEAIARQQTGTSGSLEVTCALRRESAHRFYERQGFQRQGLRLVRAGPVDSPAPEFLGRGDP
jgi:ribosomal protein S18 acetylase RimI-like enzyme